MYTTLQIHKYKTNILDTIDYNKLTAFSSIHKPFNRAYYTYAMLNEYSKPCLTMLNRQFYQSGILDIENIKESGTLSADYRAYYLSYLSTQPLSNCLLITSVFSIITQLEDINVTPDILLYNDAGIPGDKFDAIIAEYQPKFNITVTSLKTISTDVPPAPQSSPLPQAYTNIIIKANEFFNDLYISLHGLTKIPSFLLSIIKGLLHLSSAGSMYIFLVVSYINPAYTWIITLLSNLFQDMDVIRNSNGTLLHDSNILLVCKNFKGLTLDHRTGLNAILKNKTIPNYNYSLCQFMEYYSNVTIDNKAKFDNAFNIYPLPNTKVTPAIKFAYLPVIDTISMPPKLADILQENMMTDNICYQLTKIYKTHIDTTNYMISKYMLPGNKIDPVYIEKVKYTILTSAVQYFEANNIPYNKAYLTYIDKYNTNILHTLFSYKYKSDYKIVKYKTKFDRIRTATRQKFNYSYPAFYKSQDIAQLSYKIKSKLVTKFENPPYIIKQVTEGFARGVAHYITKKYHSKMTHPVSNGYCKLWEILNAFPTLLPNKKAPSIFFVAEAPGQWIHASKTFHKSRINDSELNWSATSLNPYNVSNFTKGSFIDDYGFITENKDKWIWGADDTGDILNTDNQRWYRNYIRDKYSKIDLITSDAGMAVEDQLILQKLELAQILMVLGCASKGSNCCIKHFLPFVNEIPATYYASGFFVNAMFLYYYAFEHVNFIKPLTSSPNSGEFYVVGRGFKFDTIDPELYESLLDVLDTFETNNCFFSKADIPNTFVDQLTGFVDSIIAMNTTYTEIWSLLLTCMIKKDPVINSKTGCSKFIDRTYIDQFQTDQFETWISENGFVPKKIN